jgi:uncharacterized cupredoxin-like copper-binding protein
MIVLALMILFLTACSSIGTNAGSSPSQQVKVELTDFRIASSVTSFSPNTQYHFVITNNGKVVHEFMIMPKATPTMGNMGNMDKSSLAYAENIAPGGTRTLDYMFASSMSGSHPEFACYYPGHYGAGMKFDVMVS